MPVIVENLRKLRVVGIKWNLRLMIAGSWYINQKPTLSK